MSSIIKNIHEGISLDLLITVLNRLIPLKLAESWDNVGLLVRPTSISNIKNIFLTNDLTENVLQEGIEKKVDFILSYHPPLFQPFKVLKSSSWKDRIILKCIENKISIYSPHTALDSVEDGINDWLLSPFDFDLIEPIKPFVDAKSEIIKKNIKCWLEGIENIEDVLQSLLKFDLKLEVKKKETCGFDIMIDCNDITLQKLKENTKDNLIIHEEASNNLKKKYIQGMGRICKLVSSMPISEVVDKVKKLINKPNIQIGLAQNHNIDTKIDTIAVTAGSGSSILKESKADIYITGELSHHDILNATQSNTTVIICGHSNTERGYLNKLSKLLSENLNEKSVNIFISKSDDDPLKII